MEEKLNNIYNECLKELKDIGIDILNNKNVGVIDINISKRNNKRYGCCKQEEPDKSSKIVEKKGFKKIVKYQIYKKHHIEISPCVLKLNNDIIKNTIIHELIHCLPYCNNHGKEFKKYAKYINQNLGYKIATLGNKKEDYIKSNIQYNENELYKYKIICNKCGQEFYRKRLNKNFLRKYRCGKCGSKFSVISIKP